MQYFSRHIPTRVLAGIFFLLEFIFMYKKNIQPGFNRSSALFSIVFIGLWLLIRPCLTMAQAPQQFSYDTSGFYLNGQPFQMWSGEMHFQRIPRLYWKDRIAKAKAMGLNTISTYVFWNALEPKRGKWNFSGDNDLIAFIKEVQVQGMYLLLRPGPYVCAEWDFGGLPAWLLAQNGIKIRSNDPAFMQPALNYIQQLAERIAPFQITRGGNILMLQVENEFGSYGNDPSYLLNLRNAWRAEGIQIPLSTGDGPSETMLKNGSIPGCIVGLDPGANAGDFAQAKKYRPDVPAFCSEYYPGWLTHWGEPWAKTDTNEILKDLEWLIQHGKSWNLYVLHGGTNFGFYAGANMADVYQPDITSYDYDAPIRENGALTPKYFAIRRLLQKYSKTPIPQPQDPVMRMGLGAITMSPIGSVFEHLPAPQVTQTPLPMEQYGQSFGFILYSTLLNTPIGGLLEITEVHDYANVYLNEKYVGTLDRSKKIQSLQLPANLPPDSRLDILVEAMGRINYGRQMHDPKGITERVTLAGKLLENWKVFSLPMETDYLNSVLSPTQKKSRVWEDQPGQFFQGEFYMASLGDTYLDMSEFEKGIVWVNGKNVGRYWNRGPQTRLYLPGAWMRKGSNQIIVFDLHKIKAGSIRGKENLDGD
jgi:beta-galactosidase